MKVYVVKCEQYYSNHFYVVGVYSTMEIAVARVNDNPDYRIEEFEIDDDGG